MSMAFRGQPQYAQSPMGGYNMSGYGGDAMQALGDIGGFGGFGSLSGPATMGGNYSMFGSYNPMPYQQQSYTGGYVPGYGAQLPQQFGGGYGQGYGNMYGAAPGGGFGFGFGNIGMPQMQQPNVNDLFGQYMFGQYYGQPAFNPFQATSMFGGGRRGGGGFGGGFGGARRGSRQQFQPPAANAPQRPSTPITYDTMRPVPRIFETPEPAPAVPDKNQDPNYWYSVFKENNPGIDDARARELGESRAAAFRNIPASQPAQPTQPAAPAGLYDTSNDDWGRGEGPIDASQLPGGFNWQAYLDAPSNADLRAAGVDTPSEAARHYLKYGRGENRTLGSAPAATQPAAPTQPGMPSNIFTAMPYYPQIEQALPYSFGSIDMGALPMFVDSYSGLYNNPFSFR
jgi:hypothetical protein